ncbi:MAG: hypothetical protein Q4P15_04350 [Propionibacteriaceae bacterium]|nr:hypothetical protein [Propionibacteriaceae bacterium]
MKLARLVPLVLVALVGCSPSPTTAAQVGDVSISQQRVMNLMETCPNVQGNEVTDAVALTFLVRTELIRGVGAKNGIELTDQQMRDFVKQEEGASEFLAAQPECIDILLPQAASLLLSEKVPAEEAGAQLNAIKVVVNPRHFGWDADQAVVVEESGSVSVPDTLG